MLSSTLRSERRQSVITGRKREAECRYRAKPAASERVEFRRGMSPPVRRPLGISLVFWLILAGCGSSSRVNDGPLFGTGVFHPPPKPGASISQTRMCECKACEPSNCCEGPEDDAPPASCRESYDFSTNEACGISIRSCASRCAREVWRVNNGEECDARRPLSCCRAG